MRGLKKRKSTEYTQSQAAPITLKMNDACLAHFLNTKRGQERVSDVCRMCFCSVFVRGLRNVKKQRGVFVTMEDEHEAKSLAGTRKTGFIRYVLEDRKTEVAEGRHYYLHKLDVHEKPIDAYFT
ncbi:TPA: hypothetical protein N0F65_007994 [Lagenidium giganteum]|uniref:Uncharacterized protein n=1 Tax=Lagenidium giganteum TaxID=4803 RepID=A0AAV2YUT6_9STRA|nr:TPA: hypothetical protein N0F65_007994 [Lagenidium giganteum]